MYQPETNPQSPACSYYTHLNVIQVTVVHIPFVQVLSTLFTRTLSRRTLCPHTLSTRTLCPRTLSLRTLYTRTLCPYTLSLSTRTYCTCTWNSRLVLSVLLVLTTLACSVSPGRGHLHKTHTHTLR